MNPARSGRARPMRVGAVAAALLGAVWVAAAPPTAAQVSASPRARPAAPTQPPATIADFAEIESARILRAARAGEGETGAAADWAGAARDAETLLLRVAMSADVRRDAKAWTIAAQTLLHARFVAAARESERSELASLLAKYPAVAEHVLFLLNDEDDLPGAAGALLKLHGRFAGAIANHPALAAAMAAVHDRPLEVQANEKLKAAPPIEQIWAYFTSRPARFASDLKSGPAERLVFIVDVAPDVGELEWAWGKHAGNQQVGLLYDFIQYDREHYLDRKPKRLTEAGFSLQNIARVGGVCVDQAYYAAMVGKAIGVPAVIIRGDGKSGEGHAWVGYLRTGAGRGQWDVEQGRRPEAKYFTGMTIDPRSGKPVCEAEIGVAEELFRARPDDNRLARALVEAADLLARPAADPPPIELAAKRAAARPTEAADPSATAPAPFVRQRGGDSAEKLLRDAHRLSGALPELWRAVARRASSMDQAAMMHWIEASSRIAGGRWPEFTFNVTERLLHGLRDDAGAAKAWDRVFQLYSSRPDLALRARVALAERAAKAGDTEAAYRAYEDGLRRFAGAGAFVISALEGAQKLLLDRGRLDVFAELAAQTWRRVERPTRATLLFDQTVWARVGTIYAEALTAVGRKAEADGVMRQIDSARPRD